MGCCESCGLTYKSQGSPPLPARCRLIERLGLEELSASTMDRSPRSAGGSIEDNMPGDDIKAVEIESYFEELLCREDWKLHINTDLCEVKSLLPETSVIPIMLLRLDFAPSVELSTVWDLLYDPDTRLSWDSSLTTFETDQLTADTWSVYCVTKMPFPFSHRDFTERRVRKACGDLLQCVHYSLTDSEGGKPLQNKLERATEVFSLARIEKKEGKTQLLLMNQCDMKLPVSPEQATPFVARQITTWAEVLRRKVSLRS